VLSARGALPAADGLVGNTTRSIVFACAVGAATATPVVAGAQTTLPPPTADIVYVRGGVVLRGVVTELPSGTMVRIRLANGDVETIPRSEIDRIEHATPCALAVASACFAGSAGPTVLVHVESLERVDLERRSGEEWKLVCTSPCDVRLPVDERYRIAGDDVRPSPVFSLAGHGGCVDVLARPKSSGLHAIGVVMTSLGGPMILGGLILELEGALMTENDTRSAPTSSFSYGGAALALFGVATLSTGLAILISNRHTKIALQGSEPAKHEAGTPWLRTSTWRDASTDERALPTPQVFSIFRTTF
jgi:hypothetical protein